MIVLKLFGLLSFNMSNYIKKLNKILFFFLILYLIIYFSLFLFPISIGDIKIAPQFNCCDYIFYKNFVDLFSSSKISFNFQIQNFFSNKDIIIEQNEIYPGPIFPLLLYLTKHNSNNFYFLGAIFITLNFLTMVVWKKFVHDKQYPPISLIMIFLIPYPLYFTIFVSTDLIFYFFSSIYFYLLSNRDPFYKNYIVYLSFIICLVRPNGIILLLFLVFLLIIYRKKIDDNFLKKIVYLLFIILLISIYYFPYLLFFEHQSDIHRQNYFGLEFMDRNFSPNIYLNSIFKFFIEILFKILYSIGISPSSSNSYLGLTIRLILAIPLLFGLIYLILNFKKNYLNLFVIFYFVFALLNFIDLRYFFIFYPILILRLFDLVYDYNLFRRLN